MLGTIVLRSRPLAAKTENRLQDTFVTSTCDRQDIDRAPMGSAMKRELFRCHLRLKTTPDVCGLAGLGLTTVSGNGNVFFKIT